MFVPKEKKPQGAGGNQPQVGETTTPPMLKEQDIYNLEWEEIQSGTAYLVRPGEELVFKPLDAPKRVKDGHASVVLAEVVYWKDKDGNIIKQNEKCPIMLQTIPTDRLEKAITMYGVNNFYMYIKNKGKPKGQRYYDYDIKVAKVNK
jgi:hypothetical protein